LKKQKIKEEFMRCQWIWHLYLCELNWNHQAINPLEIVPESFWPEVTDLLKQENYIGHSQDFYLKQSDIYVEFLSKGGRGFPSSTP
tara:strand:+ start:223 stop:480 length:258 start_codon:yes stop_codon:yes gene_type:complete